MKQMRNLQRCNVDAMRFAKTVHNCRLYDTELFASGLLLPWLLVDSPAYGVLFILFFVERLSFLERLSPGFLFAQI